jgi:hypothetical protein
MSVVWSLLGASGKHLLSLSLLVLTQSTLCDRSQRKPISADLSGRAEALPGVDLTEYADRT